MPNTRSQSLRNANQPMTRTTDSSSPATSQVAGQSEVISPNTNVNDNLKNELCRLATFKNWPNPNISPVSLAKAGFYYINKSDHVKCAWCEGIIASWEKNDNAFEEHKRFFPECPRVKLGPNIEIANNGVRDLGIQQISPPRRPKYSSLDARLRTFSKWPISEIQKPEVLAQAGFYYQQSDDQVRCFHCNGGLRSWQKEDDAWFEHAKWFPLCQFLKLVKGQSYIDQVKLLETQECHDSNVPNREQAGIHLRQQPITLDDAMLLGPVRQALEMGLDEVRVRNATKRHLDRYGKPFETAEELVEAVLEGQTNEDNGSSDSSSSIVREVSRILNNIFSTRHRLDSTSLEDYSLPGTEDDDDFRTLVGIYRNPVNSSLETNQQLTRAAVRLPLSGDTPTANTNSTSSSSRELYSDQLNKQFSLEEENRKLKDARLCKVCMDEEVGVVFLPCGHLITCVQCAPGVRVCPLCRSAIKGLVRTFLS